MAILLTPDNKKVVVELDTDFCLYDAPHNPPNTGTRYTSGADLYVHKARSGKNYFYLYHWSMWQGENSWFELITDDDTKFFLLNVNDGNDYNGLDSKQSEKAEELFPCIFDEDA